MRCDGCYTVGEVRTLPCGHVMCRRCTTTDGWCGSCSLRNIARGGTALDPNGKLSRASFKAIARQERKALKGAR